MTYFYELLTLESAAAVCELYAKSQCENGVLCPFRHVRGDKSVVCKHWLRGLCKKGDDCEFLHEYDMSKMPECYFYSKYSQCGNKECEFLHINSESKIKDCPWYDRGFCRHGNIQIFSNLYTSSLIQILNF
jgi:cleavage and polyadenylation specificity factor subunit 4